MKTLSNTRYRLPELDSTVAKQLDQAKALAIINAERFAGLGQPPRDNNNLKAYFEEDHLRYQIIFDHVNGHLQFKTSCHHVIEHKRMTEGRLRELNNGLALAKEHRIALDGQLQDQQLPFGMSRLLLVWLVTTALCLFDGLLSIPVFVSWGYSLISAAIMGVLFAFVLAFFAHSVERIVAFGKTLWQRRIIMAILISMFVTLFYTMACHRAAILEQQSTEESLHVIHFSPWPFTIISLLILLSAVTLHVLYHPSSAERAAMRGYQKTLQERAQNEALQTNLKLQAAAVELEHLELRQMNASVIEYGCSLEELIISSARSVLALWRKHNLMTRADGCRPPSFDAPYPFTFKRNFGSLNGSNNENSI